MPTDRRLLTGLLSGAGVLSVLLFAATIQSTHVVLAFLPDLPTTESMRRQVWLNTLPWLLLWAGIAVGGLLRWRQTLVVMALAIPLATWYGWMGVMSGGGQVSGDLVDMARLVGGLELALALLCAVSVGVALWGLLRRR